ncbi:MAG: hypothetical protein AB1450_10480 [Pseudomonadota bacterium]
MTECEQLQQCPVWKNFSTVAAYVWINNYCKGPRRERCARLQLFRSGQAVPADLLPNGTRAGTLQSA